MVRYQAPAAIVVRGALDVHLLEQVPLQTDQAGPKSFLYSRLKVSM